MKLVLRSLAVAAALFTMGNVMQAQSLSIDGKFFKTGTEVTINYTGAPTGTSAWIGVYRTEQNPGANDNSVYWAYTSAASGSVSFKMEYGNAYYAVLFGDGGYNEVSDRVYYVISDNCDDQHLPGMSIDKESYIVGEPVKVKLSNATCIENDWIGIYDAADVVSHEGFAKCYKEAGTDPNGTITLNVEGNYNYDGPLPAGSYYVGYYIANQYYEPVKRIAFEVKEAEGLEAIAADANNDIRVCNGDVLAEGNIEVYTIDGKLMAKGNNCVNIANAGMYIVRTATAAKRVIVK